MDYDEMETKTIIFKDITVKHLPFAVPFLEHSSTLVVLVIRYDCLLCLN